MSNKLQKRHEEANEDAIDAKELQRLMEEGKDVERVPWSQINPTERPT